LVGRSHHSKLREPHSNRTIPHTDSLTQNISDAAFVYFSRTVPRGATVDISDVPFELPMLA
jgi:hypothetical protein